MGNRYKTPMETKLEYKIHNHVFITFSEEINHIGQVGIKAKYTMGLVSVYYDVIENVMTRFSSYLDEEEDKFKELDKCYNAINGKNYLKNKANARFENEIQDVLAHERTIIRKLSLLFRAINKDFVQAELFPKPNKQEVKRSKYADTAEERDDAKAEELLADKY